MKLSKTLLHKIGQTERFLGRLLGPLLKAGLPVMKHLLKPLGKCFNPIRINSSISNSCSYS